MSGHKSADGVTMHKGQNILKDDIPAFLFENRSMNSIVNQTGTEKTEGTGKGKKQSKSGPG